MLTLLVLLLILFVAAAFAFWLIGQMGLSPGTAQMARVIVGVAALIVLLVLLLGNVGGLNLRLR